MSKEPKVTKINNGTVIDHIPAGRALEVYKLLGTNNHVVLIAMNIESTKLGHKDILKLENKFLSQDEANKMALIAPTATINIIRDFTISEKHKINLPDQMEGLVKCPNPMCVSNDKEELVKSRFFREGKNYRCYYCERNFPAAELC